MVILRIKGRKYITVTGAGCGELFRHDEKNPLPPHLEGVIRDFCAHPRARCVLAVDFAPLRRKPFAALHVPVQSR